MVGAQELSRSLTVQILPSGQGVRMPGNSKSRKPLRKNNFKDRLGKHKKMIGSRLWHVFRPGRFRHFFCYLMCFTWRVPGPGFVRKLCQDMRGLGQFSGGRGVLF